MLRVMTTPMFLSEPVQGHLCDRVSGIFVLSCHIHYCLLWLAMQRSIRRRDLPKLSLVRIHPDLGHFRAHRQQPLVLVPIQPYISIWTNPYSDLPWCNKRQTYRHPILAGEPRYIDTRNM